MVPTIIRPYFWGRYVRGVVKNMKTSTDQHGALTFPPQPREATSKRGKCGWSCWNLSTLQEDVVSVLAKNRLPMLHSKLLLGKTGKCHLGEFKHLLGNIGQNYIHPQQKLTCPLKWDHFQYRKCIVQALNISGDVPSFSEGVICLNLGGSC